MVKVRMNTADVAAEVKCLRRLIGMRCSNVYDLSPKTYVFKLMNSSGVTESGESEKVLLLMESGVRLHTTAYVRDKNNTPSGFTLKLRKHIRTRRLEDVRQLGSDRIILFQFGLGANAHYVILELYAQGNIILTDAEFMVLTLLRSHRDDDKGFAIMSRHRYPTEACRVFERTTAAKLQEALASFEEPEQNKPVTVDDGENNKVEKTAQEKQGKRKGKPSELVKKTNEGNRAKQATLKTVLGEVLGYGPALSEHIILDAGVLPNTKFSEQNKLDEDTFQTLIHAVSRFEDWLHDVISGDKIPEGYILMQKKNAGNGLPSSESQNSGQIYDEFCPLLLNQFKTRDNAKFDTFDSALDEFYSKIESQKSEQQQKAKESSAFQKLQKIRVDQENRVQTLRKEVDRCVRMAELIEYNLEDVDAAILAVRVALAKGMSWEDLARMVKEEKKLGNPVAALIDKLYLERNCMTLLLSNNLDEMDDDEKTLPVDKVEVDLSLSAHANARRWYEMKKKQESKQEKTVTAHTKAFKAAEKKTRLQLSQEKSVATISHMRKVHWFEKFNWFISSENYLVISGRDAQQNEMIVKRYMSKGDLYIHADLHGASSTVIKNHRPEQPIPPLTLNQAGCFTVCHSQAWDSKIVTSAWWVYPHQVSKTAPTGEYLTVGSFMIRGKKNFLPPHPLIMGFGLLFRLDESSLGSHLNERRVRGEEDGVDDIEEGEPPEEISDSVSEKEVTGSTTGLDSTVSSIKVSSPHESPIQSTAALDTIDSAATADNGALVTPELEDLIDRALTLGPTTTSDKSYEVGSSQVDMTEDHDGEDGNTAARDKRHLSKAERRKLKKAQRFGDAGQQTEPDNEELEENVAVSVSVDQSKESIQNNKPIIGKISRGQRSKLKKMKEKYADQDEEERSIRMALLASAGNALKNTGETQNGNEATVEVEVEVANDGSKDAPKICYKCKRTGHLSRDCPEHPNGTSHHPTSSGVDNSRVRLDDTASEADKVAMEEDDVHEIAEEEKEKLNDVDYLTGNPLPSDILLYAVPVCGPYSAVQSYKYRVKITPGTAKKGKAAKTAMNLFSHMPEASAREKELMKACTDPELVAAIIGNVKVTAAGLTQLKQKQKKGCCVWRMGSQVESGNGDNTASTLEAQSGANDIETGVEAIWEKMNKGVSNNMIKTFSSKSGVKATSQKHNDNWAKYLGLVPKVSEVHLDDAQENRSSGTENVASDEEQRVAAMWEKMNKGIPDKTSRTILSKSTSATNNSSKKKSDNWMSYLGLATKKAEGVENDAPQSEPSGMQNGTSDEARKLAAAALSAVKNAPAATLGRGKVEITEVREFAGQEIELKKLVDAESKEAAEKSKAPASSAVDAVLEQIKKKQKLSVLDKTKKDWGEFKEENKGLEEELDAYKKSSNQYLERVSFLERTDYREFERERDARLASQSRRRPDMREDL